VFDRMLEQDFEVDCAELQSEIKRELKRFFNQVLERRPVIYPIVAEI
jgi:ribonuclease J